MPVSLRGGRRCIPKGKDYQEHGWPPVTLNYPDYVRRINWTSLRAVVSRFRKAPCGPIVGQKLRFDSLPATSGLPRITDINRPARLVRLVPGAEVDFPFVVSIELYFEHEESAMFTRSSRF